MRVVDKPDRIAIDFQGGSHGNFLEFACNTLAGCTQDTLPFNQAGAAHSKKYINPQVFFADHYSFNDVSIPGRMVVSVQIQESDLLPLTAISLLRAGDYGYDNDELEIDTYNKLNNVDYCHMLTDLINGYFFQQVETSYNAVRDPSWPTIKTLQEFKQLPAHIQQECIEQHQLQLLELSAESPDCPRDILRDFFKIGFANPDQQGFMKQQVDKIHYTDKSVYVFPFAAFYDPIQFLQHMKLIAKWAGIVYNNWERVEILHTEFLARQPYCALKQTCDHIVDTLCDNLTLQAPPVNLLAEAYINAQLEKRGYECRY
jgi:hypothetical protein